MGWGPRRSETPQIAGVNKYSHLSRIGRVAYRKCDAESGQQEIVDKRKPDGYWGTVEAPAHGQVGGVLLLPKPHLWDLRTERWQPSLVRNGRAERPLPDTLMPVPGFRVGNDGSVAEAVGTPLADLVGLPDVWPPE